MNNISKIFSKEGMYDELREQFRNFVEDDSWEDFSEHISLYHKHDAVGEFFEFDATKAYEGDTDEVSEFKKNLIINMDGDTAVSLDSFNLSIAKLYAVSEDHPYDVGDIILTSDDKTGTIQNPAWEEWFNTDLENSNANKVGKEPPKVVKRLLKRMKHERFHINKLLFDRELDDRLIFHLPEPYLIGRLSDPKGYMDLCIEELEKFIEQNDDE